jgi:hypothetical protein
MIKTDPTMLVCDATPGPWQSPIESTYPQVPLECSECHQMTGGPA